MLPYFYEQLNFKTCSKSTVLKSYLGINEADGGENSAAGTPTEERTGAQQRLRQAGESRSSSPQLRIWDSCAEK